MAEDIKLEGNVFPVIRVGDDVDTPDGPAVVYEIAIHGGKYGDRFELEPPAIFVKMADDEAIRQVCMCVLKLSNIVHEKLLSKEFDRLWPPIDEDVPEDAYMLVDHDKEESTVMRSIRTRTAEMGDFFNLSEGVDRITITPTDAQALDDFEVELADLTLDENRIWMEIFKDVGMPHRWIRPADVGAPADAELIAEVDPEMGPVFIYIGDDPLSDLQRQGEIVFERFKESTTMSSVKTSDRRTAESDEARELKLYLDNDSELYERLMRDFYGNLIKKLAGGRYDRSLSPKLFMYFVEAAARKYCREHCSSEKEWSRVFDKSTRMEVAEELADDFESEIRESGDMEYITKHIPKKYRDVDLAEMLDRNASVRTASELSEDQADIAFDEWKIDEDVAVAVFEMLEEEDLPIEDVEVEEDWGDTVLVSVGSKMWGVAPSYESAEAMALQQVRQDLEDEPGMFTQSWLMQHVDEKRLADFLHSNVFDSAYDRLWDEKEQNVEDAIDELDRWDFDTESAYGTDDELDEKAATDLVEALIDDYADKVAKDQLSDPMSYLEDIYGREDAMKQIIKWNMIDTDDAAESAVDEDGAAHFIARYDGNINELTSGGVYWRHN